MHKILRLAGICPFSSGRNSTIRSNSNGGIRFLSNYRLQGSSPEGLAEVIQKLVDNLYVTLNAWHPQKDNCQRAHKPAVSGKPISKETVCRHLTARRTVYVFSTYLKQKPPFVQLDTPLLDIAKPGRGGILSSLMSLDSEHRLIFNIHFHLKYPPRPASVRRKLLFVRVVPQDGVRDIRSRDLRRESHLWKGRNKYEISQPVGSALDHVI